MKERIILAPGLNGNELIKNMALHGVDSFNLRVTGAPELARIALMRTGVSVTEDFVDPNEELGIIAKVVKGNEYFKKTSYADLRNIAAAVRRMRTLTADPDEAKVLAGNMTKGIFKEKNNALMTVYENYMKVLQDTNQIDSVLLIRKAIAESGTIDAEFVTLEEFQPDPLSEALINKLSGGKYTTVSIRSLYKAEDKPLEIASYRNCYGATNEVETIINDIYDPAKKDTSRLDKCTVAVTDPATYAQLFLEYSILYNIPVTFGCGLPVINSYPGKLLSLYLVWMTSGFYSAGALDQMIHSGFFRIKKLKKILPAPEGDFSWRVFYECLGEIGFTRSIINNRKRIKAYKQALEEDAKYIVKGESREYKEYESKLKSIPLLEVMAEELALPTEEFIYKYAVIRHNKYKTHSGRILKKLDIASRGGIYATLNAIHSEGVIQDESDIITNILKAGVLSQMSEPGCLHITTIDKAMSSVRETLYIAGLSASRYPGSPKEDYLLLDCDIGTFGEDKKRFTSEGRVNKKKDDLISLAQLASSLGSKIHLSYPGLNVSELKKDNASSMIYELYSLTGADSKLEAFEAAVTKVAYFEPKLSKTRALGQAYIDGVGIKQAGEDKEEDEAPAAPALPTPVFDLEKEYSPSALEQFWGCPRRFLLERILGIPQPESEEKYDVLSAADFGTLAHSCMEQLANNKMTLEEFKKLSGEFFDRFIAEHPPLMPDKIDAERKEFLETMEKGYIGNPHDREVVLKEEELHYEHETGVKLKGFPDRVEKDPDTGKYIVVDYKTGRHIKHKEDDINTCLQVVIYAYMMEKKGYEISGCVYRYLRLGDEVTCRYDDDMKQKLTDVLDVFKTAMTTGVFKCASNRSNKCTKERYCYFENFCGVKSGEDEWKR